MFTTIHNLLAIHICITKTRYTSNLAEKPTFLKIAPLITKIKWKWKRIKWNTGAFQVAYSMDFVINITYFVTLLTMASNMYL